MWRFRRQMAKEMQSNCVQDTRERQIDAEHVFYSWQMVTLRQARALGIHQIGDGIAAISYALAR